MKLTNQAAFNIQHSTPKRAGEIPKPRKLTVPLADGLRWTGGGNLLYLRKYDGCWQPGGIEFQGNVLIVERMKPTPNPSKEGNSSGEWFAAHSVAAIGGQNVLEQSTRTRWRELCRLAVDFPAHIRLAESGNGGEFLAAVLDQGGEGVCAFDLDAPWGEMWACKRVETFIVTVIEKHAGGKSSVRVGKVELMVGELMVDRPENSSLSTINHQPSTDLGWLPLFGRKFDQVRVGSVLKVEGYGLTDSGKIREPRVCRDTETSWLVRY